MERVSALSELNPAAWRRVGCYLRAAAIAVLLGVHAFVRSVQVVEYDEPALAAVADAIVVLAQAEGLPAHGEAVRARIAPGDPA